MLLISVVIYCYNIYFNSNINIKILVVVRDWGLGEEIDYIEL